MGEGATLGTKVSGWRLEQCVGDLLFRSRRGERQLG